MQLVSIQGQLEGTSWTASLSFPQAMWSPWPVGGSQAYEMSLTGTEEQVGAWSGKGLSHQGSLCPPEESVGRKNLVHSLNYRALLELGITSKRRRGVSKLV